MIALLEVRNLVELFIVSWILKQIYSLICPSPHFCAWIMHLKVCLSLVPRLSQHKAMFTKLFETVSVFSMPSYPHHFFSFRPSPPLFPHPHLDDTICEVRLVVYGTVIQWLLWNQHFLLLLLFQTGDCFIQVIFHKNSTTATRTSGHKTNRWLSTTIDRFHSSDNAMSENAAYQLITGIGSQW